MKSMQKESDLYYRKLFSVVKSPYEGEDIYPDDQGMSRNKVFLWEFYRDLIIFNSKELTKIEVTLPLDVRFNNLTRVESGVYYLRKIESSWVKILKYHPINE